MDKKALLELRKKIKTRKPNYLRQDYHKKKRLGTKWRKAKGIQSKVRLGKGGHRKKVRIGYCSPKAVKHLHKSGLKKIMVYNVEDLDKIKKDQEGAIIAKIGKRKKINVVNKAKELGIQILNIKDTSAYLEKIKKEFDDKKKIKQEKLKATEKKKKETKEKEEMKEKEKLDKKIETEEDKNKKEKKEQEKILNKKK